VKALQLTNITKDTATILLYKHIGMLDDMGEGVNGAYIASDIQMLNEYYAEEVKCINVRINSVGGSVAEGLSIVSAILNSTIPVNTYIDGMAYSMAGVIAVCGNKKYMADYATFMMHNAGGGDDDEVLNLITNSLAKVFERNTNMTLDKCKDLMNKETWMTADECINLGIVDEIIQTKKKLPAMTNSVKELHSIYNRILTQKKTNMNKVTDLLKLSNEASEEAIVEAINAKEAKIQELQNSIDAQTEELNTLKASIEAKEVAEKAEVITNAVKDGKIDEKSKDIYLNSGKSVEELKALVAELKPAYTPIMPTNAASVAAVAGREKWTFNDWSKNDPKGLAAMRENDKTTFDALINALPKELSNSYNPATDKKF
jgi:ATP-dependent protease ClpP protease subunit